MPGAPRQEPMNTRKGRAQALLRLSRPVLQRLTETQPLRDALDPFRCKPTDAFSATAFIHSFGCRGPSDTDWTTLFAAAGALRSEDLSVLIAYTACPGDVDEVVFGSPGILDHVCRLWDEWLIDEVARRVGDSVEAEASCWGIVKSAEGFNWQNGRKSDGLTSQHLLGQSVDVVGMRIVKVVTKRVFEQVLERVSFGGRETFMETFAGKWNGVVDGALGRAKSVLVEKVFEVAAGRNCYTA